MKKALFLDRDGVINYDYGYVHRIENFIIKEDIYKICINAKKFGYLIIIITNQAGIGRGIYSLKDFLTVSEYMIKIFELKNISFDAIFFCPFHPQEGIGYYRKDSYDRKPKPGMILRAIDQYNVDISKSIFIGDKKTDELAAKNAFIKNFVYSTDKNWVEKAIAIIKSN